jgi:hypothetical protein
MNMGTTTAFHPAWRRALVTVLLGVGLAGAAGAARAQAADAVHGADGIFVAPDVAIVWAVLKEGAGDKASVWLRIVNRSGAFSHVAIDGVDPFTRKREKVEAGVALKAEARLASDRDTFSDLPSREVHFYRTEADWRANKPALNVYYLGVPDTTPEFSARAAMDSYLDTVKLIAHPVKPKP